MDTQDHLLSLIETGKPLEIKRALAVRMSIKGYSRAEIAQLLDVSLQFIDKWKPIYFEKGAEGLKLNYKGSEGYLSKQERESIIKYILAQECMATDELKAYITTKYGVTYNSMQSYTRLLNKARARGKKT